MVLKAGIKDGILFEAIDLTLLWLFLGCNQYWAWWVYVFSCFMSGSTGRLNRHTMDDEHLIISKMAQ